MKNKERIERLEKKVDYLYKATKLLESNIPNEEWKNVTWSREDGVDKKFENGKLIYSSEKLTSLDNTKIALNSPEENEEVQKMAFDLGYKYWGDNKFYSNSELYGLKFKKNGGTKTMLWSEKHDFKICSDKQITISQIRELHKEKMEEIHKSKMENLSKAISSIGETIIKGEELPKDNWYVVENKDNINIIRCWFGYINPFSSSYGVIKGEKHSLCAHESWGESCKEVTTEQFKKIIGYKEPEMYMGFEVKKYEEPYPIVEVSDNEDFVQFKTRRLISIDDDVSYPINIDDSEPFKYIRRVPKERQVFG
jgi:hypothetical protein